MIRLVSPAAIDVAAECETGCYRISVEEGGVRCRRTKSKSSSGGLCGRRASSAENSGLAAIIRPRFPHDAIEAAVYERAACDVRRSGARAIAEEFALKMDEESAGRYGSKFEELPSVFRMEILRERGSEAGWSSFVQALAVHTYNQISCGVCAYKGACFIWGYLNRASMRSISGWRWGGVMWASSL